MALLVVGSVAFDSIDTPHGRVERVLGGSGTYLAYAASLYTNVRLIGVVGDDFTEEHVGILKKRGIDLSGLKRVKGKTFFWHGRYFDDMNERETLKVDLNVFGDYEPELPEKFRDSEYVFLANARPALQIKVREQLKKPRLVFCDTMDLWIETRREELLKLLGMVDGIVLNDGEARKLTENKFPTLIGAGKRIMRFGPKYVIIKKGEHGALLLTPDGVFATAAYPLEFVFDPTGAGDTFGGGVLGYLAKTGDVSFDNLKKAVIHGTVVASFTVEKFSLDRLREIGPADLDGRYAEMVAMLKFC
jgi:sugar/nucleoside kinase (ribokinase family)